ncbi:MAG: thiamine pyrophosphate-binding protein [Planctomycetaceae bacterium]
MLAIDVMLSQLVRDGFTTIFGNPGTFEQALIERLKHFPRLQYVMCLHEAVVVGAAIGYARVANKPAFIQLHGSVGLGNATGMLLEAKQARIPLVVYVGENAQYDEAFGGFLAFDLVQMAKAVCKETIRVTVPEQLQRQLRRAIQVASTPPFGPVLFDVPMDVLEHEIPDDGATATHIRLAGQFSPDVIRDVVGEIVAAKRILIVVGDPVAWCDAQNSIRLLSHLVGAPVYGLGWTMGNAVYDDPLFQEPLTHAFGKKNAELLREADLLLVLGAPLAWEVIPDRMGYIDQNARVIQVDTDPSEIGKNFHADIALHADIRQFVEQVIQAIGLIESSEFRHRVTDNLAEASQRKRRSRTEREARWNLNNGNIVNHPAEMIGALADCIGREDLIFEEAMTAQQFLRHSFPLSDPRLYFPVLSRTLGAGLSGAIGAKIASQSVRVVGISSDGAALYVPQSLWTAAHQQLPILFVILNNQSYRVLKVNLNDFRARIGSARSDFPFMDLSEPAIDFVKLAESFGVAAQRATTPVGVRIAIDALATESGPTLLDLQIDGNLNY